MKVLQFLKKDGGPKTPSEVLTGVDTEGLPSLFGASDEDPSALDNSIELTGTLGVPDAGGGEAEGFEVCGFSGKGVNELVGAARLPGLLGVQGSG